MEKSSIIEELEQLESLLKDGSLTSDEFRNLKSALILRELQANSPPKRGPEDSSSTVMPHFRVATPASKNRTGIIAVAAGSVAVVATLLVIGSQSDSPHQQTTMPREHEEQIGTSFSNDMGVRNAGVPGPTGVDHTRPAESHPASVEITANDRVQPNRTITTSFDCGKADKLSEKLICGDPGLAAMDVELASLYRRARAVSGDSVALLDEQLGWISKRDECSNRSCLVRSYSDRKTDVKRWLVEESR